MPATKLTRQKPPSIADQLRTAITESEQTVYVIAKGTGVSQSILSRFVTGERDLRLETAAKVASFLELHLVPIRR